MNPVVAIEARWGGLLDTVADRLRAQAWRLRGAAVGERTRIGYGCRVERPWALSTGARVQVEHHVHLKIARPEGRLALGAHTFIGFGSEIDVAAEVVIGEHVLIAPGCFITDHGHRHARGMHIDAQGVETRPVRIGNDAWLGAHAVVLPGVSIGAGSIVGAGAVVTRDVAPGEIVAGVPARRIGERT